MLFRSKQERLPTPAFLPGESHRPRGLSPQGCVQRGRAHRANPGPAAEDCEGTAAPRSPLFTLSPAAGLPLGDAREEGTVLGPRWTCPVGGGHPGGQAVLSGGCPEATGSKPGWDLGPACWAWGTEALPLGTGVGLREEADGPCTQPCPQGRCSRRPPQCPHSPASSGPGGWGEGHGHSGPRAKPGSLGR